ncbi:hypothetical protein [uncultured Lutibacter sp.]|uniref:hypothetical protein n=1 Tax=uncultured Lutibacter sp. TaxID=437739 RepID=UPI002623F39D|nr:hypothetical protein [uncultured Lutibacter sp.]
MKRLRNNEVGRNNYTQDPSNLKERILDAINDSSLGYLRNQIMSNFQATYSSQLIPTNQ